MRLFAALFPDAAAVRELERAVRPLRALPGDGAGRVRWTPVTGWHLTLAFYGEVPDELVPTLRGRLAAVAAARPGCTLRLAGGGRFGDRALWAGVAGDTGELMALAAAARDTGRALGLLPDARPEYVPHLTVALTGRRAPAPLAPYAERLAGFAGRPWTAGELVLVRSETSPEGSRYATEASWPLAGGRPG
ncbi:RNA 2',3'-cyclic phosphodiesterase [Streptomyces harbinensis]|uniref:RNA 2',3'-cyclic phosphodiesterase n=1 Tax=Streptomyces harbinensis TaxID=1176198 RepID=UPI0036A3E5B7